LLSLARLISLENPGENYPSYIKTKNHQKHKFSHKRSRDKNIYEFRGPTECLEKKKKSRELFINPPQVTLKMRFRGQNGIVAQI